MVNKAYVFLYSDEVGTRAQVKKFLDGRPEIVNWKHELPNSFFLISPNDVHELSALIRTFAGEGRFLVMECSANRQGYLDRDTWAFLLKRRPWATKVTSARKPDGDP